VQIYFWHNKINFVTTMVENNMNMDGWGLHFACTPVQQHWRSWETENVMSRVIKASSSTVVWPGYLTHSSPNSL
jgi:hypothetical protein